MVWPASKAGGGGEWDEQPQGKRCRRLARAPWARPVDDEVGLDLDGSVMGAVGPGRRSVGVLADFPSGCLVDEWSSGSGNGMWMWIGIVQRSMAVA